MDKNKPCLWFNSSLHRRLMLGLGNSLAGGAAIGFSPADIADCKFWFTVEAGIESGGAGTVITSWESQVGTLFAGNATANQRPTFNTTHVTFDGGDSLDFFSDVDLSSVISLHSLANKYLPSHLSKETYYDYKKKDLDSYLEMYYPQNMNIIKSPQFCQKYTTEWDSFGNPHELETAKTCVTDHNQYSIEYNQPWFGPGVMYDRSSKDKYSWLKDPARGNIIRAQGY